MDDAVTGSQGFSESVKQANEYGYDVNGNLTSDANKGYSSILYNYLNLPRRIGTASQYISYLYDAAGTKLAKIGTANDTTYYAGSFIYSGSSLNYILHREGMYLPGGNYQYFLKDHLGNTRLVVNTVGTGGAIAQQTDYYPFGMDIASYNGGLDNKYRYNGKEFQNDVINSRNLQWYDYGARFYDPVIGRWHSVDPSAEDYFSCSPYVYVGNNPIRRVDPDGNDAWDIVLGLGAAVIDNAFGGFTNIRENAASYVTDANDFNSGLDSGDAASIAIGVGEIGGGEALSDGGKATVAASLVAEIPSGGTSTVSLAGGAAAVATGEVLKAHGVLMMGAGAVNAASGKGRLPEETGTRTKNRLPDKGDPNSMSTNKPGTTTKKYGSDGNVQKEYNKGHQGSNTPKNEKSDHVHDYKPSSHPKGKPERQPGRPPKKNEMSKDIYKTQNGN